MPSGAVTDRDWGTKGGGSEAIAPSGARPGRVFCICRTIKFAEKVKAKYGKAQRAPMPPGLSPTGDWGIIRYSHPVLKDSAQGVAIAERCIWNIRLLIEQDPE